MNSDMGVREGGIYDMEPQFAVSLQLNHSLRDEIGLINTVIALKMYAF